jgi:hypothetical protein
MGRFRLDRVCAKHVECRLDNYIFISKLAMGHSSAIIVHIYDSWEINFLNLPGLKCGMSSIRSDLPIFFFFLPLSH